MSDLQDELENYLDQKSQAPAVKGTTTRARREDLENEALPQESPEHVVPFEQQADMGFFEDVQLSLNPKPNSTPRLNDAAPLLNRFSFRTVAPEHCLTYFKDPYDEETIPIQMYQSTSDTQVDSSKTILTNHQLESFPLLFESDEQDYMRHALNNLAPSKKSSQDKLVIHGTTSKLPMEPHQDSTSIDWLFSDGLPLDYSPRGEHQTVVSVSSSVTSGSPLVCGSKSSYPLNAFNIPRQEKSSQAVALFLKNDLEKYEAIQKANEQHLGNVNNLIQQCEYSNVSGYRQAIPPFRAPRERTVNKAKSFGRMTNAFFFDQNVEDYGTGGEENITTVRALAKAQSLDEAYFFDPKVTCSSPLKYEAAKTSDVLASSFEGSSPVSEILNEFMSHVKNIVPPKQHDNCPSSTSASGKLTDYFSVTKENRIQEKANTSETKTTDKKLLLADSLVTDYFPAKPQHTTTSIELSNPIADLYALFKKQARELSSSDELDITDPGTFNFINKPPFSPSHALKPKYNCDLKRTVVNNQDELANIKVDFANRQKIVERCLLKQQRSTLAPALFRPNLTNKTKNSVADDFELLEWDDNCMTI